MEICRQTALKKKMAHTSERKVGCLYFHFFFHSLSFPEKKKRKRPGTKWRGKQNGEYKMANVWIRAVGEELLEKRSFSVIHKRLFADLFLAM